MRILISGAGIGGLALAQALRRGGLEVAVYERDPSPQTRRQGYRIHIDHDGNEALRACLPPEVLDLAHRTSGDTGDRIAFYTQDLVELSSQVFPDIPASEITNVDRDTFRQSLLTGLDVSFGHTVTGYDLTPSGRVRVALSTSPPTTSPTPSTDGTAASVGRPAFSASSPTSTAASPASVVGGTSSSPGGPASSAGGTASSVGVTASSAGGTASSDGGDGSSGDGSSGGGSFFDEGDLLVGADGVGSAVRRQLAPSATLRDLGLRCLYGRMPLDGATLPPDFGRGFSWVAGANGYGAGFAPVRFRTPAGVPDYLMTTLVAPTGVLGNLDLPSEALQQICLDASATWHPAVRHLFAAADPTSFFPIAIRAGTRITPWSSGQVTLLGDAIHTMPPAGGVGANTALQDAALLAAEILSGKPLPEAVAAYESVMLPRGFDTIDKSIRMIGRMVPQPGARP
ncbi:FAD-dependent oxidoreductase [Paractinoplanes atraurantiacus]|nr:FAD-dependent monooxygenase [Actinoplanes atraurantiacus]